MRVILIFAAVLVAAVTGGFVYLVRQADVAGPTPQATEVAVDVELAS